MVDFCGLFPSLIASSLYGTKLKGVENKTLYTFVVGMGFALAFFDLIFVLGWYTYLGIPTMVMIFVTSLFWGSLFGIGYAIPGCVIIAKLTPSHVEASVFAIAKMRQELGE